MNKKPKEEKKHFHKWQYAETFPAHPIFQIVWEDEKKLDYHEKCVGWTKESLRFVCECGKIKLVKER